METARISALLRPFLEAVELSLGQLEAVQAYTALLMRWNSRTNLTAVRDEEHIVTRHIGESLFAARHLIADPASHLTVIDIGSGAGFPGLPIKLYAPGIDLSLIESQNKKATFLKEAIRTLRLADAHVFSGRAETFGNQADLVTMRAVERFGSTVLVAASLVRPGGRLALLIGEAQRETVLESLPEVLWAEPRHIPLSSARVLLTGTRQ